MNNDAHARVHERLAADEHSIRRLRQLAAGFARDHGASQRRSEDIALAVSEAVTNAVTHAYPEDWPCGTVELDARIEHARLVIRVIDEGTGIGVNGSGSLNGLGLWLIGQVSDEVELLSRDPMPGLQVKMVFSLT